LGFSGNGKGEPEVVESICEIDRPGCFVIDYEANVTPEEYEATLLPLIKRYRMSFPCVPILVVSRINFIRDYNPLHAKDQKRRITHAVSVVEELKNTGDDFIHYVDGSQLLGENWRECTVDGTHPTDLGFLKMADSLEAPLIGSLQLMDIN